MQSNISEKKKKSRKGGHGTPHLQSTNFFFFATAHNPRTGRTLFLRRDVLSTFLETRRKCKYRLPNASEHLLRTGEETNGNKETETEHLPDDRAPRDGALHFFSSHGTAPARCLKTGPHQRPHGTVGTRPNTLPARTEPRMAPARTCPRDWNSRRPPSPFKRTDPDATVWTPDPSYRASPSRTGSRPPVHTE